MNDINMIERSRKIENFNDQIKKRHYTKSKLLELRRNKKCQEWPRIFCKKFIGIDGKWDPVGAFENNNFSQRTQSRESVSHYYNERYTKHQRNDYKYYGYDDGNKQYDYFYGAKYYYPSNSKQKCQYNNERLYGYNKKRNSPDSYYSTYSYSTKYVEGNEKPKESTKSSAIECKPEWFTGGPSNINETIELSGMSSELEAGILKNRKSNRKNEENYARSKVSASETDSKNQFWPHKSDNISQMDSHLLRIIQRNAKENDKRKTSTSAKEVEKVLKSILLKPNEECQETSTFNKNPNGIVLTVNEVESSLRLKGNRGAGDMSAYYKLLGLVQNNVSTNQPEGIKTVNSENKTSLVTITSTNNNHPRQFINSKYSTSVNTQNSKDSKKINDDFDSYHMTKIEKSLISENTETQISERVIKPECNTDVAISLNSQEKLEETAYNMEIKKLNGINNYNLMNVNTNIRNEKFAMASRTICNPLSNQFSNHILGSGQNNNAAAASARITQINQTEYCSTQENLHNDNVERKSETDTALLNSDSNSLDALTATIDNNFRMNMDQSNVPNQLGSYINNFNLNSYVNTSSLYNQLSLKQFLSFGYSQNSMFGSQFLNPYFLQQLFMHKQWENRNISLQNQLRQFQSMIFNCKSHQNVSSTTNNSSAYITSNSMGLNQGNNSEISISK